MCTALHINCGISIFVLGWSKTSLLYGPHSNPPHTHSHIQWQSCWLIFTPNQVFMSYNVYDISRCGVWSSLFPVSLGCGGQSSIVAAVWTLHQCCIRFGCTSHGCLRQIEHLITEGWTGHARLSASLACLYRSTRYSKNNYCRQLAWPACPERVEAQPQKQWNSRVWGFYINKMHMQ